LLHAARQDAGTVFRRVSPYDDASDRAAIQIARPVLSGGETVGYAVIDVTERQLETLFEGWNGEGEYLLMDRFWEEIVCSPALQGEATAATLRASLLASGSPTLPDSDARLLAAQEELSGFTLILLQEKPLAGETQLLLHGIALGSIVLSLLLCFWFAMRMSRRVSQPVQALNDAMRRVEEGDLDARAELRGSDELAQLSGRFNGMTQRLKQNLDDSLRQQRELGAARMRMM
jgi:sensor histidine kinase YesM